MRTCVNLAQIAAVVHNFYSYLVSQHGRKYYVAFVYDTRLACKYVCNAATALIGFK